MGWPRLGALVGMLASLPALAQGVSAPGLVITPSVTVSETLIDSRRDRAGAKRSDAITTISPGVRIVSRAGRVQGTFDYSLAGVMYARDSDSNDVQHRLAASVVAEAIQDHLYVDMRGSVARQAISALGPQSADPTFASSNYSQVKTFTIAPVLRGTPGGVVDLSASMVLSTTDSGTSAISDSDSGSAALRIGSVRRGARLGWALDATRRIVDFERGRRTEEDRLIASVAYSVNPELRLDARVGVEDSNVASLTKTRTDTWGGGFFWTPTDRTRIAASGDRRAFGHSHAFEFQHRMRRLVWRLSDRQDVTSGADASGAAIPAYDLFFALYASQEPDPVRRAELVNSLLQRANLSPTELVNGGFLTGASALQRRQELSLAVEGVRTTFLVSAFNSSSRRAFALVAGLDDLDAGRLDQRGLTFSMAHKVTPNSSISLFASTQRAVSDGSGRSGRLNSITANWTERLGRRSDLTLGARHSEFDGTADVTSESALQASLRMTF